jgi:hypothetical protein
MRPENELARFSSIVTSYKYHDCAIFTSAYLLIVPRELESSFTWYRYPQGAIHAIMASLAGVQ